MKSFNLKQGKELDQRLKSSKGAAITEAALVIPVLALILFGIIQYGLILSTKVVLENALAVGMRQYSIDPLLGDTVLKARIAEAVKPSLIEDNLSVSIVEDVPISSGFGTSITVTYNYPLILPYVVPGNSDGALKLSAAGVMRSLSSP